MFLLFLIFFVSFFYFLAMLRGMWDLSSPTRDRTCALALEAWSLNHWTAREVPRGHCFKPLSLW